MKTIKLFFILLLSALVVVSGYMVVKEITVQNQDKEVFKDLRELVDIPAEKEEMPDTTTDKEAESSEEELNLLRLRAQNVECIGWIRIEDTNIDYPVMYTPDNPQKYLRKNFYGVYSQSGVPFLDARCSLEDSNLLIYGHNMKNGTMFSDLKNYLDSDFREAHKEIILYTESGQKVFIVAEVIKTDIYDKRYEKIETDCDRCLMLSTCYGKAKTGRLLIIAKEAKNNV